MARLRRPDLRVLYMSGYTDFERILEDTGPRFGKLLQKPFRPADLGREIETALAAGPDACTA
jgi:DNA-binding NtrC family response regulator